MGNCTPRTRTHAHARARTHAYIYHTHTRSCECSRSLALACSLFCVPLVLAPFFSLAYLRSPARIHTHTHTHTHTCTPKLRRPVCGVLYMCVCMCARVCLQAQREQALNKFRSGEIDILVATDVRALCASAYLGSCARSPFLAVLHPPRDRPPPLSLSLSCVVGWPHVPDALPAVYHNGWCGIHGTLPAQTRWFCFVLQVAARGLDIAGVKHVINFDLASTADEFDSYVPRPCSLAASQPRTEITALSQRGHMHARAGATMPWPRCGYGYNFTVGRG